MIEMTASFRLKHWRQSFESLYSTANCTKAVTVTKDSKQNLGYSDSTQTRKCSTTKKLKMYYSG